MTFEKSFATPSFHESSEIFRPGRMRRIFRSYVA